MLNPQNVRTQSGYVKYLEKTFTKLNFCILCEYNHNRLEMTEMILNYKLMVEWLLKDDCFIFFIFQFLTKIILGSTRKKINYIMNQKKLFKSES